MKILSTGLILALLAANAPAQSLFEDDYIDVELWYGNTDAGNYSLDSTAYSLAFSKALTRGFSLIAGYRHSDFDELTFIDAGPSQDAWDFGIGYRHEVLPRLEAFGNLRWLSLESEIGEDSQTDYGALGELGLMAAVSESFGLATTLRFADVHDPVAQTSRELSLALQARWQLNDRLSLAFGGELGEYENAWLGSIRYSLGSKP